ncbi:MAG: hypothetical protein BroJett021_08160 [Chloroflexota bacterium]|nr:hypothetical protein [Caldilinea sp.]GIK71828.1 MAG: hypothetical protein BroJett021_08160 [Chloroflexota bacterium]
MSTIAGVRPTRAVWGVLLLIGAGVVLRSLRLDWQPLWWDEGYSVYFATEPLLRMFDLTARDIHPPLYYVLLHGWIELWQSATPVVLRILSVLLAVLALPLQAWLAWRLFPGRTRLLLIAALLLALNPMHLFYSQEVRMYGLGMTLSIASTLFFWRWRQAANDGKQQRQVWLMVGYVAATLAGLYTLYYFVFIPVGHLLWALFVHRQAVRRWWPVAAVQMLIAALFLPWLFYTTPRLVAYVDNKVASDQDVALDPVRYIAQHTATFSGGHLGWPLGPLPWALLFGGAAILAIGGALIFSQQARSQNLSEPTESESNRAPNTGALGLLASLVGTTLAAGWLLNLRFPFFPEGGERLLMIALPYVLLLLAAGIDHTWRVARAGQAALLFLLLAAIGGVYTFYTTPRYVGHDYRPIVRQIVQQGRNRDAFLAIFPWQVGYWRAYAPQQDPLVTGPAPRLLSDDVVGWSAEVQAVLDDALAAGVVWFPEPLTFGATLPFEIEEYLAAHASNLENRWYDATRLTAWAKLAGLTPAAEAAADFGAVRIVEAAVAEGLVEAANQPVAVHITWEIVEPADLNISLRLLDSNNQIWSSREYAVAWSSAQPGTRETHLVGVFAPVGLPPGVYTVGVSVARQDARGESANALTVVGSDTVDAPIGVLTVAAPETVQSAARLPIRTPLSPPVAQNDIAFLGFTGPPPTKPLLAGTELVVTLFLQALADTPADRLLYVSLLDRQGNGVAGFEGWPLASFPPPLLVEDELLRVPVRFFVPATLPSGDYRLVTGFQEPATGAKTPSILLGGVRVEQRRADFTRPTPPHLLPTPAQFGTHVRLYGYALEETGDNALTVRLYWEVIQPLLPPHHIFVHLQAADGAIVAQQDAAPFTDRGPAPTGSWQPGEFLVTRHPLPTANLADHHIRVGIYDPATLLRLPVTINGEVAGDSVALGVENRD